MQLKRLYFSVYIIVIITMFLGCNSKQTQFNYYAVKTTVKPIIDGNIDSVWLSACTEPLMKTKGEHVIKDSNDLSASFRILWDEECLYILCKVNDDYLFNTNLLKYKTVDLPSPWECDAIELFIDSENTKEAIFDPLKKHFKYEFVFSSDKVTSHKNLPTESISFSFSETASGYICEICIPFKTLGIKPYVNQILGFEITVNDNDNDPEEGRFIIRRKVLTWAEEGVIPNAWRNTSVYGNLHLKE